MVQRWPAIRRSIAGVPRVRWRLHSRHQVPAIHDGSAEELPVRFGPGSRRTGTTSVPATSARAAQQTCAGAQPCC